MIIFFLFKDDSPHCDLEKYFLKGINFIEENRKYTNVLVHCFAGICL